jgi:hypothetical protein
MVSFLARSNTFRSLRMVRLADTSIVLGCGEDFQAKADCAMTYNKDCDELPECRGSLPCLPTESHIRQILALVSSLVG